MSEVLACCNDIYVFTDIVGVFKCKEFKDFANITEPAPVVVIFDEYGCETRVLIKDIEKYFEMCIKTLKPFETIVLRASNLKKRKLKILASASPTRFPTEKLLQ